MMSGHQIHGQIGITGGLITWAHIAGAIHTHYATHWRARGLTNCWRVWFFEPEA